MPSMTLLRKITEGLGAWLHYEYCCDRSELFSEKYLATPVGALLSSSRVGQIFSEFEHPILTEKMSGPGRRPALDFVVCKEYPVPSIAIETKWIGGTTISVDSVVWDLVRLALLNLQYGTTCYFLLGGKRRNLKLFFGSKHFKGSAEPGSMPVLRTRTNFPSALPLTPVNRHRIPLLRKVFDGWPATLQAPTKILARRTAPFARRTAVSQYQVYAWEISCTPKKELFWPKRSSHYSDIKKRSELDEDTETQLTVLGTAS